MSRRPQKASILVLMLFASLTFPAIAQNKVDLTNSISSGRLKTANGTDWHKNEFGAKLNQGSFSSNWTGGGVNSLVIGLFLNALDEKKVGKNSWRSDLHGHNRFVRNKGQRSRKNVDRIFLD